MSQGIRHAEMLLPDRTLQGARQGPDMKTGPSWECAGFEQLRPAIS